jgi:hypothetical protein
MQKGNFSRERFVHYAICVRTSCKQVQWQGDLQGGMLFIRHSRKISIYCLVTDIRERHTRYQNVAGFTRKRNMLNVQVVIWVVTLCCDVVGYQRFEGPCFLHLQTSPWRWRQYGPPKLLNGFWLNLVKLSYANGCETTLIWSHICHV